MRLPKQTFFNLTEIKRNTIIQTALDEFAQNSYLNASVTKIAEKSGVSKGSMYQYFHDKKDLYKYILELIGQKKLYFIKDCIIKQDEMSFIENIRMLYKKGLEFAIANPLMASIANNFVKEQHSEIREEILKENQDKSNLFFINLIEKAKSKGEISSEINSEMGAYIIYHFNNVLIDMLMNSKEYDQIYQQHEEFLKKVDDLLFILEKGLIMSKN